MAEEEKSPDMSALEFIAPLMEASMKSTHALSNSLTVQHLESAKEWANRFIKFYDIVCKATETATTRDLEWNLQAYGHYVGIAHDFIVHCDRLIATYAD